MIKPLLIPGKTQEKGIWSYEFIEKIRYSGSGIQDTLAFRYSFGVTPWLRLKAVKK